MKIKTADFVISAPGLAQCPPPAQPEFAFIGRSNVGKSSLINMLTERRDLAKVSGTPGKTRLVNFFLINGQWHLVDLPGYGYAKVAKSERFEFNLAVSNYLEKRDTLLGVFVLIDARIPPQNIDLAFIEWLVGVDVPFALVFTKTEKMSAAKIKAAQDTLANALNAQSLPVPVDQFITSAVKKTGRNELLRFITDLIAEAQAAPATTNPIDNAPIEDDDSEL